LTFYVDAHGLTARRGPKKTRRSPKVQRGPNFKFNPGPRLAFNAVNGLGS